MTEQTKNTEMDDLDTKTESMFKKILIGGVVLGAGLALYGAGADHESVEGFGQGILAMDVLMGLAVYAMRYIKRNYSNTSAENSR